MRVSVSWSGGGRKFAPGRYVIGRSAGCDIVFDEPSVSPRHAELAVGGTTVVLFDLRSASGVFVNGERIRKSHVMVGRELVRIGSSELEFTIRNETPVTRSAVAFPSHSFPDAELPIHDAPANSSDRPEASASARALAVIGVLAERAIAARRVNEAETMLAPRLSAILDDAKSGTPVTEATFEVAIRYGLSLAQASTDGRWFDYVIELLAARHATVSDVLAGELRVCLEAVRGINLAGLRRYAESVERFEPSLERIRTQHHLQSLMRVVGVGRAR